MTWVRKSTSVDAMVEVELSSFSTDQLLQGLIDAGVISAEEALSIKQQAHVGDKPVVHVVARDEGLDVGYLESARIAIARGKKDDALHYIEHFLGREWIGRLQ